MEPRKKFINKPEDAVADSLRGLVAGDDRIQFHKSNPRVILRSDVAEVKKKQVTLISGGGSGHEPFAAGLVGKNGLTAAIAGNIFASPPSADVEDALEVCKATAGTLIFVINYTGDRLNFGMAGERVKTRQDTKLDLVHVDDDIALEQRRESTIGGRGLAGALLVLQISGALAGSRGAAFDEVRDVSRRVVKNMSTFSATLYSCALPGGPPMFTLAADEMELALGIHGEPGLERRKMQSAAAIVDVVLETVTKSERLSLKVEEPIVVLLNNLGGTSQLEMGILQSEILSWLIKRHFSVVRIIVGTLMTSLDSHGFSVTILRLADQDWLSLLDMASAISAHWRVTTPRMQLIEAPKRRHFDEAKIENIGVEVSADIATKVEKALRAACKKLVESEKALNELDAACGDGDCGSSMASAAKAILDAADSKRLKFNRPKTLSLQLSRLCEHSVGGTSGALYALFFGTSSRAFDSTFDAAALRRAIVVGLHGLQYYSHAQPQHRTMVDPLHAAVSTANNASWEQLVRNVEEGAEATAKMEAKSGRASYTSTNQQRAPDAGAKAVALWFRACLDALQ